MSNFAINNNGRSLVAGLLGTVDIDLCLWENYKLMGHQLAIFNDADASLISVEQKEHRRYTLKKLNELQNQIRQCPGFERFLLPLTDEEILGLAQDGPLVCFNVSDISSEAFLVTTFNGCSGE